jgi:hypothetical protein
MGHEHLGGAQSTETPPSTAGNAPLTKAAADEVIPVLNLDEDAQPAAKA